MNNYLDHAFVTLLTTTNPWHTLHLLNELLMAINQLTFTNLLKIEFSWELLNRFPVCSYILSVNAWVSK